MWSWLGINDDPKTKAGLEDAKDTKEEILIESQPGDLIIEENKIDQEKQNKELLSDVAANLGNYFYTFANKATKTASKLKETVDEKLEKTIVGDFQRENEKFVQEKEARRVGDAVPPWTGYHEESTMKRQILALSSDERNFLRDPPSGVDYQFSMDQMMPVAIAALKEDDDLQQMRFSLVPKRVKEERFWRNYFYRVSLIKQSTQLSSLAEQDLRNSSKSSSSESLNIKDQSNRNLVVQETEDLVESPTTNEFVSDDFQENEGLSEEEKNQMLGESKAENKDTNNVDSNLSEDWEKEIQEELEGFEFVNDDKNGDHQWEQEIEDMLDLDEKDKS